ncbi:MAG: hypothetical protein ACREJ0_05740 [Geminicoccaceae bacterium]
MVNEGVENLDPSGIVAGRSDRLDVIRQLAVEFDENGIVTGVYETRRDIIWLPFQSDGDQPLPVTTELSGSPL